VTQQAGRDAVRIGDRVLWSWHPWPQHYLAAAGMALFGRGTWQARLPFALVALACVPLFHAWRLRRGDDPAFAAVATAIFALSPAFYLFGRQCRYYPLLFLGGLWAAWSYDSLRAGGAEPARRVGPILGLALALALVFYANPLTGVALAAGFAVHGAWSWRRGRLPRPGRALAALALFALLAAPWLALLAVSEVRAPALGLAGRSNPARTARSASSSCALGYPK
jgi:4-amino-4-deoxy-L-arabinose transferase-like glycosyltransferase